MNRRLLLLVCLTALAAYPAAPAWAKKAGFTISQHGGTPGEMLTISGRTLHPKRAVVVFIDGAGRETSVAARAAGRHTITFAVPPFLDVDQFRVGAGTVRVAVQLGSSPLRRPVLDGFEIGALPTTGVPPGALTVAVLEQLANLADVTVQNLKTVEAASRGHVDVSSLRARLLDAKQQYLASKSLFEQVMTGSASQVPMGQVSGHDVFVDASSLALVDQLYAAYLSSSPSPASRVQALDATQDIADEFQRFLGSDVVAEIASFTNRFQSAGDAVIAVGTLGLIALTGEVAIPLAAGAVMGGLLYSATTWVPAAQMAALEGGSHLMIEDQVSVGDFRQSTQFLFDRVTGKLIDGFTEKLGVALTGQEELVQIEKHLLDIADATASDAPPMVREIRRSYKATLRGLSGCSTGGCCPERRPIDCGTFCCDGGHPLCGSDGSCTAPTTTTVPPGCSNPSYPVPCAGFCCPAGTTCDGSGCCGGDFPVACTDYCCSAGGVCGQNGCTNPCPPERPVACGGPVVCCVAGSVCGRDCNTGTTTSTLPSGAGWCNPIGVGTCVACSSNADCVTFLGGTGTCTFNCNPGGTNPCPSACP